MPSFTRPVGPLTVPLSAGTGAPGQAIADPAVDGILAFLAWTLDDALNARLATFTAYRTPAGAPVTAVPSGQTYPWDPREPRGNQIVLHPPCLFAWRSGESVYDAALSTTVLRCRRQSVRALWVFFEPPQPVTELSRRAGLFNVADAAWHQAAERGYHKNYSPVDQAGHTWDAGTPVARVVAAVGDFAWDYVGGAYCRWGIGDDDPTGMAVNPQSHIDYPCLAGLFTVYERVTQPVATDPADVLTDTITGIAASDGSSTDTTKILDRYLPGWTGDPRGVGMP